MMKKTFEKPAMLISKFNVENIVTDSTTDPGTQAYDFGTVKVDAKDVLKRQ